MKRFGLGVLIAVSTTIAAEANAGSFWFPLAGYYPYSSGNNIQSIPDLDNRQNYMRSRMNETGDYWDGYRYSDGQIGFKKDRGGDWEFDGVPYAEDETYLYYDNHRGYDFAVPEGIEVHTVEGGTFCGTYEPEGQVCVQHNLSYGTFRTYYTHMDIADWVQYLNHGDWIGKWAHIGDVSDVSTANIGVHLHFVTYKYEPNHSDYSTRVGTIGYGWIVVDPYGLKDGVGGTDLEPYLWN